MTKKSRVCRAKRPIFVPQGRHPYVQELEIEFDWFPGFSLSQVRKRIASLHNAASLKGISPILEISSKSEDPLGVKLSAFNLCLRENQTGSLLSIECAYQGSKVFEKGGPYTDLYYATSRDAKVDPRLKNSGKLIGFNYFGIDFPITPPTAFYDWLYIKALCQNMDLSSQLLNYQAFSDIAFNPKKSINCQARSAALFVALHKNNYIEIVTDNIDLFLNYTTYDRKTMAIYQQMEMVFD